MSKWWAIVTGAVLACVVILGAPGAAAAQGRGGGRGAGGPGMGNPGGGRSAGGGSVDRGLGTSSERSGGRSDTGRGRASEKSQGRSEEGLEHARKAGDNARQADAELREHPGLTEGLHVNANDLRSRYQAALATNPNLKFGQFVAANRLAQNLGARYPNVTTASILDGLAAGHSIGRTLQDLGLSSREARDAERSVHRQIKESKRRS